MPPSIKRGLVAHRRMGKTGKVDKLAKRVAKVEAIVKEAELKYIDTDQGSANIDYNGTVYGLSNVGQGSSAVTRTGNMIKMMKHMLTMQFNNSFSTASVRYIIFLDKSPNGALPTVNNVLQNIGNARAPLAMYNSELADRFTIIKDKCLSLSNTSALYDSVTSTAYTFPQTRCIKHSSKRKVNIRYKLNAGDITDAEKHSVLLLVISNLVTTNLPQVQFRSRILFSDM